MGAGPHLWQLSVCSGEGALGWKSTIKHEGVRSGQSWEVHPKSLLRGPHLYYLR